MFGNKKRDQQFLEVPIRDNFYQTSSFFPMPVTLISTLDDHGNTNLGAYSLVFPHTISGEARSMKLITRASSNTAQNIVDRKVCAINFIPDEKKFMENCVELGYPGDTTAEKMERSIFTLTPSFRTPEVQYPSLVEEAIQVFECRWDGSPHAANEDEFHFVLRIEKIIMQSKWSEHLEADDKFPPLPVDYGFRGGVHFWFSDFRKPYAVNVPEHRQNDAAAIQFQANRIDPDISWEIDACEKLVSVPRVFLNRVLKGIVAEANERGVSIVNAELMDAINADRA